MNPAQRQLIVLKLRKQMRKNNWIYLGQHPEVRAFIRVILNALLKEKPKENIYDFIAQLFSCENLDNLSDSLNDQLKRLSKLKDDSWTKYDGEMFFDKSSESEISAKSRYSTIVNLLKFSGVYEESESDETIGRKSEYMSLSNIPFFGHQ